MTTLDAKTLELIASKICHDLISPIGAINNGLEIFEEMGPDAGADVTGLIASSAQVASSKLQAYRLAYGAGGSDGNLKPEDAHSALAGILEHEARLSQDWDFNINFGSEMLPTAIAKMLTAFLLLTMECLPKGGVLSVAAGDNGEVIIKGAGDNAALRDGFTEALHQTAQLEDLSPAATHAYMTGLLAKHYGYGIQSIDEAADSITFVLSTPAL